MPIDALCLTAVARELHTAVVGARIVKIYQPGRDMIVLLLHTDAGRARLLLSGGGILPRVQLTALPAENPAEPPMFCMLLRRHLTGARIVALTQPPAERVLRFAVEGRGDLGDKEEKELVFEGIGRQGNVILCGGDGRILDCLRRAEGDIATGRRHLMPGMFYRLPDQSCKANPLDETKDSFMVRLATAPEGRAVADWLIEHFGGMAPLTAREIVYCACGSVDARLPMDGQALWRGWKRVVGSVKENNVTPSMLMRDGLPADVSFVEIAQYEAAAECCVYQSFSALFDDFYSRREGALRTRQRGQNLLKLAQTARDRLARKMDQQRRELAAAVDRDALRRCGDLLTGSLHLLEKGMTSACVPDYFDPDGATAQVALNPLLTPQQNAAWYYKRYRKAKTAQQALTEQLEKASGEMEYLDSYLDALSRAEGEADFIQLRSELEESGYAKRLLPARRQGGGKKAPPAVRAKPLEVKTPSGFTILVGRNNLQNEQITMRLAARHDLWLHARGVPGAHVILRTEGRTPDDDSLAQAARLAAQHSKSAGGVSIAVDCTFVKHVKKHPCGRPGMVTYTGERTILV